MSSPATIDALLDHMWQDYLAMNPQARSVRELFEARGESVVNDHIALRTFGMDPVGIEALAAPFLASGYVECGRYTFPTKKLRAVHYQAPGKPKVFISELLLDEMPADVQDIIAALVTQLDASETQRFDFCTRGRPWSIDAASLERLAQVSEYAAWVAAHGFRPNHFTVLVNSLETLESLEAVNDLLTEQGIELNSSGGVIKGTPGQLLEQSSTLANTVRVELSEGPVDVPGCYYEFARRYVDTDGELYQGFIAASADRIFESTDRR